MKKIKALFTKIGADDTGIITFEMLQEQFRAPAVKEYFETLGLDVSDAWSFFKLLDADGGQGHVFGVRLNSFEFVFFAVKVRIRFNSCVSGVTFDDGRWLCGSGRVFAWLPTPAWASASNGHCQAVVRPTLAHKEPREVSCLQKIE